MKKKIKILRFVLIILLFLVSLPLYSWSEVEPQSYKIMPAANINVNKVDGGIVEPAEPEATHTLSQTEYLPDSIIIQSVTKNDSGEVTQYTYYTTYKPVLDRYGRIIEPAKPGVFYTFNKENHLIVVVDSNGEIKEKLSWSGNIEDLTPENYPSIPTNVLVGATLAFSSGSLKNFHPDLAPDVKGDRVINKDDLIQISQAFGTSLGDKEYNANADVNSDGTIDISDLVLVGKNFGSVLYID